MTAPSGFVNGIDYVVVDKETSPRDRNWGVTIAWSHPFLAQLLPEELFSRLAECQPDPHLDSKEAGFESVIIRDGKTGATMVQPPFPGVRRLNLQKTRKLWSQNVNVKFGKSISDIELTDQGVMAHFHDGTVETGTVLVGADGGGSWVRRWMLGEDAAPTILPYTFLNFPVRYTAEQALKMDKMMHPIVDVGVHPKSMYVGIFLLDKPVIDKPETWVFYLLATWTKDEQEQEQQQSCQNENMVDELRRRMDGWADPYKSAVEWIPEDVQAKVVPFKIWAPKNNWDNRGGRITLAGDAAHSMTFRKLGDSISLLRISSSNRLYRDRGQGANNAIRDCERFVSAMVKVKSGDLTLAEAVAEYDRDVITRGRQEVEVSRAQTDAFHDYAAFLESPIMKYGIRPISEDTNKG
ncbi:FAD-dependent monooxygenase phnB [Exophiala dermatitidis]